MSGLPFHLKYRPKTLERVIGHEKVVARLRGMLNSKKIPNALLFLGPSSAGKTTLARCFAAELNSIEGSVEGHPDYMEINAAESRGIDDVRQLLEVARLMPTRGSHRVITIDEAQQLTGAALQAFLKPLEQPSKHTVYVLCSMDPDKFSSGPGRALANRCQPFVLESHTQSNIVRHLTRIAKAEKMTYVTPEILADIAQNSSGEMRTAASLLEATYQYVASLERPPKTLKVDDLDAVFKTASSSDDEVAIRILVGVYARKFSYTQRAILDITDGFGIVKKLLWMNAFMLNTHILKGERHSKVWSNRVNQELASRTKSMFDKDEAGASKRMDIFAATQVALVDIQQQASSFLVPEQNLIGARLYHLVQQLKTVVA